MSETIQAQAHCLCGAITIKAASLSQHVNVCHCDMCRIWAGAPYFALEAQQDVSFEGEENLSVYASSEWADRGFCAKCGTHLFYRFKQDQKYMLPAGLFKNNEADFTMSNQIFIDEKPAFYNFVNNTPKLTAAQVFAELSDQ